MSKVPEFLSQEDVKRFLPITLRNLSMLDNFQAFVVEGLEIPAAQEVSVRNALRRVVPNGFLVVRQTGAGVIRDGTRAWTEEEVSLRNIHATDSTTATVIFFVV